MVSSVLVELFHLFVNNLWHCETVFDLSEFRYKSFKNCAMELHDKKRLLFNALDKDKRCTFCRGAKTDVTSFDSCSQVSDYLIEWIHDTFKNSLNLSPSRALICSLFIMI